MALDKKQYDRGTIDSAEELDAYGVWVKSEPQDFTASLAETANFDAEAMPYEANFDPDFDNLGGSNFGFGDSDDDTGIDIPEASIEDSDSDGFDEATTAYSEQVTEEASNRLLMKIAGELSSIKSELKTLKREFAEIRAESGSGAKDGEQRGGFFAEDDDEKIALTGDEMDHFLSSTDFSEEDGLGYDTLREKDEAALKEVAEQNEISSSEEDAMSSEEGVSEEPEEEIQIDFDNLGIDLDQETEKQEEFPPLDEEPPLEELDQEEVAGGFVEELAPLEDSEELKDLRLEGATPLSSAPDNSDYLETDPFVLDSSDFEGTPLDADAVKEELSLDTGVTEDATQDTDLSDMSFSEEISEDISGDSVSDGDDLGLGDGATLGGDDLSFDDSSFDIGFSDDFTIESPPSIEEETTVEQTVETAATETEPALDETDHSLDETTLSLDESDLSFDMGSTETSGALDDSDLSFDAGPLELSATGLDDTDFSFDDDEVSLDLSADTSTETSEDISAETSTDASELTLDDAELSAESPADQETGEKDDFDADSLDLSDAVIDEPDLSAGIVEAPLEEPVLGDISFNDDISLDMDDFGSSVDIADDSVPAVSDRAGDDSLAQIIPEGFEVNAQEAAVSVDDDLEAFADDDLAIAAGAGLADAPITEAGADGISPSLKGELKSVLAYMDHLLESLPEEKIEEFAKSEYFDTYKKIFKELGLV